MSRYNRKVIFPKAFDGAEVERMFNRKGIKAVDIPDAKEMLVKNVIDIMPYLTDSVVKDLDWMKDTYWHPLDKGSLSTEALDTDQTITRIATRRAFATNLKHYSAFGNLKKSFPYRMMNGRLMPCTTMTDTIKNDLSFTLPKMGTFDSTTMDFIKYRLSYPEYVSRFAGGYFYPGVNVMSPVKYGHDLKYPEANSGMVSENNIGHFIQVHNDMIMIPSLSDKFMAPANPDQYYVNYEKESFLISDPCMNILKNLYRILPETIFKQILTSYHLENAWAAFSKIQGVQLQKSQDLQVMENLIQKECQAQGPNRKRHLTWEKVVLDMTNGQQTNRQNNGHLDQNAQAENYYNEYIALHNSEYHVNHNSPNGNLWSYNLQKYCVFASYFDNAQNFNHDMLKDLYAHLQMSYYFPNLIQSSHDDSSGDKFGYYYSVEYQNNMVNGLGISPRPDPLTTTPVRFFYVIDPKDLYGFLTNLYLKAHGERVYFNVGSYQGVDFNNPGIGSTLVGSLQPINVGNNVVQQVYTRNFGLGVSSYETGYTNLTLNAQANQTRGITVMHGNMNSFISVALHGIGWSTDQDNNRHEYALIQNKVHMIKPDCQLVISSQTLRHICPESLQYQINLALASSDQTQFDTKMLNTLVFKDTPEDKVFQKVDSYKTLDKFWNGISFQEWSGKGIFEKRLIEKLGLVMCLYDSPVTYNNKTEMVTFCGILNQLPVDSKIVPTRVCFLPYKLGNETMFSGLVKIRDLFVQDINKVNGPRSDYEFSRTLDFKPEACLKMTYHEFDKFLVCVAESENPLMVLAHYMSIMKDHDHTQVPQNIIKFNGLTHYAQTLWIILTKLGFNVSFRPNRHNDSGTMVCYPSITPHNVLQRLQRCIDQMPSPGQPRNNMHMARTILSKCMPLINFLAYPTIRERGKFLKDAFEKSGGRPGMSGKESLEQEWIGGAWNLNANGKNVGNDTLTFENKPSMIPDLDMVSLLQADGPNDLVVNSPFQPEYDQFRKTVMNMEFNKNNMHQNLVDIKENLPLCSKLNIVLGDSFNKGMKNQSEENFSIGQYMSSNIQKTIDPLFNNNLEKLGGNMTPTPYLQTILDGLNPIEITQNQQDLFDQRHDFELRRIIQHVSRTLGLHQAKRNVHNPYPMQGVNPADPSQVRFLGMALHSNLFMDQVMTKIRHTESRLNFKLEDTFKTDLIDNFKNIINSSRNLYISMLQFDFIQKLLDLLRARNMYDSTKQSEDINTDMLGKSLEIIKPYAKNVINDFDQKIIGTLAKISKENTGLNIQEYEFEDPAF